MLELGVDFGAYTPNVTYARLRRLREEYGVEWATIGLTGNPYLLPQLRECVAADVNTDTYLIPRSWYSPAGAQVRAQLDRLTVWRDKITPFVWIDVESLPYEPDPPHGRAIEWVGEALEVCEAAGWKPGIYTSREMWRRLTGNTREFADRPLWEAFYSPYRAYVPFRIGGWQFRAGVQWQGSTLLAELNVDLNTWETRETDMTEEQIKNLIGETLALGVRLQNRIEAEEQKREQADSFTREVLIEAVEALRGGDQAATHAKVARDRLRYVYAAADEPYPYP